ncbi:Nuclear transport factor 2 family protein [Frankia sp. AiPs1]|uniref:nuclear transport factor 2 family protein n=1 Tax=Frankia sp. AiPa1 TaxID=573492 RepID=UPI00202BA34D|nr:nuclear transport factor 2 family protein [Frankia sp. AiPa1]MCL9760206.1 nuclear transport factor 2 family protein [Frankia sp. AiPa1]
MSETPPEDAVEELRRRLLLLEDERAIGRVVLSYGPAADSGQATRAGSLWHKDGLYDWDAGGDPLQGGAAVESMLQTGAHQGLIGHGVAHFAGPMLIDVQGDRATALNYSLIMRREEGRFYLWRVSVARWDLERLDSTWKVRCRTNRLLDSSGAGRELLGDTLDAIFGTI